MAYKRFGKVHANLVDTKVNLSPLGAFFIVQDSFTEQMQSIGTDGPTALEKFNAMWVVSMNKVEFIGNIKWNEEYETITSVSSKQSFSMTVDTLMSDTNGNKIIHSTTQFCGIDVTTGRIRKVDTIGISDELVDTSFVPLSFDKSKVDEMDKVDTIVVKSTNIDYLHHTNNLEYIRFIMNTYSVSDVESHPVKSMQINYLKQTHEGDILDIYKARRDDGSDVIEIRNSDIVALRAYIYR